MKEIDYDSPEALLLMKEIDDWLDKHDHFRWHIAHVELEDYNIFWNFGTRLLEYIDACLKREYDLLEKEHSEYLKRCMDTLRKEYFFFDDEWLNNELYQLKLFVHHIRDKIASYS